MAESAIFDNRKGRSLVVRQQGAGNINLQLSTANVDATETVVKLFIEKIMWSGNCNITRGAGNVIFSFASGTAGMYDLYGNGMTNKEYPTSNLVVTVADGGSCVVLVGKESTFTPASTY